MNTGKIIDKPVIEDSGNYEINFEKITIEFFAVVKKLETAFHDDYGNEWPTTEAITEIDYEVLNVYDEEGNRIDFNEQEIIKIIKENE